MDNNVDINEELRIKNQELFLNKKKIDLETSMDTVIVFFSNYTNGLATEVNNKVCEMKNIDPNSEQSKIMGYTITKFFANLADELKKKVLEIKADIGIGFDGDGDRIGIIDELGNMVAIEDYGIIILRNIINKVDNKKFLYDAKCSDNFKDEIIKLGGTPVIVIQIELQSKLN